MKFLEKKLTLMLTSASHPALESHNAVVKRHTESHSGKEVAGMEMVMDSRLECSSDSVTGVFVGTFPTTFIPDEFHFDPIST